MEPLRYRERLWPRWWLWSVPLGLVGLLAAAYGSAYGAPIGWAILIPGLILAGAATAALSPTVSLDRTGVIAGRARLPWSAVSGIRALDATALSEIRRGGDVRAFTMLRPWTASTGVEITVTDDRDPHPTWLMTTRRPDRFVALGEVWRAADAGAPDSGRSDAAE